MRGLGFLAALGACTASVASAFYVPSIGPQSFKQGERVPLFVNRVFSEHVPLPFAYYDLPFVCKPTEIHRPWLNIGEVLRGDRIASSDYELVMGQNNTCRTLCTIKLNSEVNLELGQFAEQDYLVEWLVDKLPSATVHYKHGKDSQKREKIYESGFRIGDYDKVSRKAFLNNHVALDILYEHKGEGRRIVGFEVYPRSIQNDSGGCPNLNDPEAARLVVGERRPTTITYSYSVNWIEDSSVPWNRRWDRYLSLTDSQVHWYAIFNSAIIILLLSGVVSIILMRMLNRDLAMVNDEEFREDIEETSGWKLLHGDVFRAPGYGGLLAPLLGTTVQVMYTFIATIVFGIMGILSPSYRGGLLTTGIVVFLLMGSAAGYYSCHLYKTWGGNNWFKNSLMTATLVPIALLFVELFLNMFLWYRASSAAMPLSTIILLFALWLFIELPLTMLGGWIGFRRPPYSEPVRTNAIPRPIPPQPKFLGRVFSILLAGSLPFAVIFIELFFVLKSIWQDAFYYEYGFTIIVGLILSLTVCESTIIMVWLSLNSGNHKWWWRAFSYGASSSVYIFAYSVFFYFTRLRAGMPDIIGFVPTLTFFIHSLLISAAYALCTGSMGFFAAYFFVRRIYRMVKLS
ncbi:hypothetical protein GGI25_005370 [Coemansia spiralis]|uniref:Transmembrane 9 superfamily member n=2 Tax=Coemansia TaxID=4863 RepID=A0A9W8KW72_9FUNG|nr:hypothetical protein BX070DRAFT_196565 [Coemansia spiralis]KAJ1988370.1 hypothetical protein EDC05_005344 [Coemansia umbellata]KAJ2619672.1 hypothetical protein GGI26_005624 [Coemansia sp. RSA 1358]KAJ2671819.1 hypothetical protein GGI25_005370 [Coemansia spiralis]